MGDPLRIAMIAACPFPAGRGTPVRILRMAEGLARRGHEVHVVTYPFGQGPMAADVTIHRIRDVLHYRRTEPGPSWQKLLVLDPLLAARTWRLLRARRIDVVHAHHVEGLLAGLVARGRRPMPIVYDVHTILRTELPFYGPGVVRRLLARVGNTLDHRLPRHAAFVVAAHDDIRLRLIGADPRLDGRIAVVPSGVELDRFMDAPVGPVPVDGLSLVYAGNLATYQGIDLMLHAFANLRSRRADVRLRIVSDSPFVPYEALATSLGVRHAIDLVPGALHDLPRHLTDAAVALNPRTVCDGLPQKLVNYMAAGAPIVSFRGSAKHLTEGEHGVVVEDGDVIAFAAGIDRLLDDPALARRLGTNARAYAREKLTWERTAEQVEAVYRRILA
jgi:glycosyltransferase involved in cell wall biosynthesis